MKRSFKKAVAFSMAVTLLGGCLSGIPVVAEEKRSAKKSENPNSSAWLVPAEYGDINVWDYGALLRENGTLYRSGEGYQDYVMDTEGNITKIELPDDLSGTGQANILVGLARRKGEEYSSVTPTYYQIVSLKYNVMVQKGNSYGFYDNQGKLMNDTFYENITPCQAGYLFTEGDNTKVLNRDGLIVGTYSKQANITDIVDSGKFQIIYQGSGENKKVVDIVDQNGKQVVGGETILSVRERAIYDSESDFESLLHCIESKNPTTKEKTTSIYLNGKKIVSGSNWTIETKDFEDFHRGITKYYDSKKKKYGFLTLDGKVKEAIYDEVFYYQTYYTLVDTIRVNQYMAVTRTGNTIYNLRSKDDFLDTEATIKVSKEILKRLKQDNVNESDWTKVAAQLKLYELQSSEKLSYSNVGSVDNIGNILVSKENSYGVITTTEQEIIPTEYDKIEYKNGGYIVQKNGKYGFYSTAGKEILECNYSFIDPVSHIWEKENNQEHFILIIADEKNKYGLMSEKKQLVPCNYDEIKSMFYYGSYYLIQKDGKVGVVNEEGDIIVPLKYESIFSISKGQSSEESLVNFYDFANYYSNIEPVFLVKDEKGNYGVCGADKKMVLSVEYSYIKRNSDGSFIVQDRNKKMGLWSALGEQILPAIYTSISSPVEDSVIARRDKIYSLYGLDRTLYQEYQSISGKYYYCNEYNLQPVADENIIIISNSDGKVGILDRKGKQICDFIYDQIKNYISNYRNRNEITYCTELPEKSKFYILKSGNKVGLAIYFQQEKEELEPTSMPTPTPKPTTTPKPTPTPKPTTTPKPTPTPTPEIIEEPETESGERIHIVVKGDTMGSIATKYYGNNANRTALYNYNKDAFEKTNGKLVIGMKLRIPDKLNGQNRLAIPVLNQGENLYTVKLGDTLAKLAREFYKDASKYTIIYERNKDRIKNPNLIYVGQEIVIPK